MVPCSTHGGPTNLLFKSTMQINIKKCPDKKFVKYVKLASKFYVNELFGNSRINKNCITEIVFDKNMEDIGIAYVIGKNTKGKNREFSIELNPHYGANEILSTLAHEFVHVKQFAFDETNESLNKWMNVAVDSDHLDYWILPWEIDAHGREVGLFRKLVLKYELWKVFKDIKNPNKQKTSNIIAWK